MVIFPCGNAEYVICKILEEENKVSYLTIGEDDRVNFYFKVKQEKCKEEGTMIRHQDEYQVQTEFDYITSDVCYRTWFEVFSSQEQKELYLYLENKMADEFCEFLKEEIIKNLYSYYIKENDFKFWKNSFEDRIVQISDNETYIDDKKYDIFYKTKNNGEYEIEFYNK